MVIKKAPTQPVFTEANPIMAEAHGLETKGTASQNFALLFMLIKQSVAWSVVVLSYLYNKRKVYNELWLFTLAALALYISFTCAFDFFHDLGYLIGIGLRCS